MEIDGVVALAKRYPDVIQSIVVGNEVLLRGELSAQDLRQCDPRSEAPGPDAGDLCRCLGILAA